MAARLTVPLNDGSFLAVFLIGCPRHVAWAEFQRHGVAAEAKSFWASSPLAGRRDVGSEYG